MSGPIEARFSSAMAIYEGQERMEREGEIKSHMKYCNSKDNKNNNNTINNDSKNNDDNNSYDNKMI